MIGDALEQLRLLPSDSVHCVVTSPPYYGLRDYGVAGQIGLESSPDEYVLALVDVFREVRRVLRDDGTLWLVIGDCYNNRRRLKSTSHQSALNGFQQTNWKKAAAAGMTRMSINTNGLKEKDVFGVPWLLAMSLRSSGWYLRQEIIWVKTFGKPEPVRDKLALRHETIFMLSKSKSYRFDKNAMPEWSRSSVWTVAPIGQDRHGAAFPPALVEPCILAGCPEGGTVLDPFGGAGTTGLVADRLGRDAVLIDLNPEYAELARRRIENDAGMFAEVAAEAPPAQEMLL